MRASALLAVFSVVVFSSAAWAVDSFTLDVVVTGPPEVSTGNPTTTVQVIGHLTNESNIGLAFFTYGLRVTGPVAQDLCTAATFNPALPAVQASVDNFHKDKGFSMEPLFGPFAGQDLFNGACVGGELHQLGGGQNTIANDPNQSPFVPFPGGGGFTAVQLNVGHGVDGVLLHEFQITLSGVSDGQVYNVEIIPGPDAPAANKITSFTNPTHAVASVDTVIGSSGQITIVDCNDVTAPAVSHATALPGETTPCTGLIDPRWESNNGATFNQGIDRVTFVFSETVFSPGGGDPVVGDFSVTETGPGPAPTVTAVNKINDTTYEVVLSRIITLQQWTTVIANVVDGCDNPIANLGDLGPGNAEPDRIDIGFLPGDINQNGTVEPVDLTRMRQFIVNQSFHNSCADVLYFDTNRNGVAPEPVDLTRYRALILGGGASTQVWQTEGIGLQP